MPRVQARSKTRKKQNGQDREQRIRPVWLFSLAGMLGAIVVSGLSVVGSAAEARSLYQALGEIQRQHDQLLEEHSRLSIERSTMSSLQKIESRRMNQYRRINIAVN